MKDGKVSGVLRCDICGRLGARVRRATRTYGRSRNELLIRNVPVFSCSLCGESYMTAETLHEIERIKLHRRRLAEKRPVEVAEFVRASPEPRPNRALQRSARSAARR